MFTSFTEHHSAVRKKNCVHLSLQRISGKNLTAAWSFKERSLLLRPPWHSSLSDDAFIAHFMSLWKCILVCVCVLAFLLDYSAEREAIYQGLAQERKLLQTDKNIRGTIFCLNVLIWPNQNPMKKVCFFISTGRINQ